jgi:hypothetical protein
MADFNVNLTEAQGVGVQMATPSTARAEAIGQVASSALKVFEEKTEKEIEKAQEQFESGVISDFANKQLDIANAVNSGQMSPLKARMLLRSNAQKAITSYPTLAEDVIGMHSKLMKTSGLGKSAAEAAEAFDKVSKEAVSKGWVTPDMTKEQKHLALAEYSTFVNSIERMKKEQAEVTLKNSKLETKSKTIGIDQSELELNNARLKRGSKNNITHLTNAYVPKFRSTMTSIADRVSKNQMTEKEAILAINEEFQSVQMITSSVGTEAGREFLTSAIAPLNTIKEDTLSLIKGEIDKGMYDRKVQTMIAMTQLNALEADEVFLKHVAVSQLSRHLPAKFIADWTLLTKDVMKKMAEKEGQNGNVFDKDKKGVKLYFNSLEGAIKNVPDNDQASHKEIRTHYENILRSIPQYANSAERMADYIPVVDFLASPTTGKYIKEKGGIPAEFVEGAKDVLDFTYQQRVLPMIQEEFSKHNLKWELPLGKDAPDRPDVKTSLGTGILPRLVIKEPSVSVIEPLFSGSGVRFQAIKGLGESDEIARNRAKTLNNLVSPMVNKFIRLGAHLEGHTDYRKVFEENFNNLFAPEPSEE